MFKWVTKGKTGRGASKSLFAKIYFTVQKANKNGKRLNCVFSEEFMEKYNLSIGDFLVVGYDTKRKKIGMYKTIENDKGFKIFSAPRSVLGRIILPESIPFDIDKINFDENQIYMKRNIIIFNLPNKIGIER